MHLLIAATNGATYPFEPRYMEASVALALLAGTGLGMASLRRRRRFRTSCGGRRHDGRTRAVDRGDHRVQRAMPACRSRPPEDVAHLLAVMKSPVQGRSLLHQFLREHTDAHHGLLAADGQVCDLLSWSDRWRR
ncbi:MAG: hypothetical protein R3E87_12240 [Burkholderiaceae bacterium]